jgi:hypothetical protein
MPDKLHRLMPVPIIGIEDEDVQAILCSVPQRRPDSAETADPIHTPTRSDADSNRVVRKRPVLNRPRRPSAARPESVPVYRSIAGRVWD